MVNVLLLYDIYIPSVKLCGDEQLKYLSQCGKIKYNCLNIRTVTKTILSESDIVFFVRSSTYFEQKLVLKLKKAKKYLVYVLDDDLLEIFDESRSALYFKSKVVNTRIKSIMKHCDMLLSPSQRLIDKYGYLVEKSVKIDEPSLKNDMEDRKQSNLKLKIGFAGSWDRTNDIDIILSDAIRIIKKKYSQLVDIEFMGAKPKIVDELNLVHYPYEDDYEKYVQKMKKLNWDIGLAPLPDTPFHKAKYFNKYIEYGAYNIVGIYSNVEPYNKVIVNKYNGFICNNTTIEWVEILSRIIEHKENLDEIRNNISDDISQNYNLKKVSEELINQIIEMKEYKSYRRIKGNIYLLKIQASIVQIYEYIIRNVCRTKKERKYDKRKNN